MVLRGAAPQVRTPVAVGAEGAVVPRRVPSMSERVQWTRAEWFVSARGQRRGPISFQEMVKLVLAGDVGPAQHVWHEGASAWLPVRDHPLLRSFLPRRLRLQPSADALANSSTPPAVVAASPAPTSATVLDLEARRREQALLMTPAHGTRRRDSGCATEEETPLPVAGTVPTTDRTVASPVLDGAVGPDVPMIAVAAPAPLNVEALAGDRQREGEVGLTVRGKELEDGGVAEGTGPLEEVGARRDDEAGAPSAGDVAGPDEWLDVEASNLVLAETAMHQAGAARHPGELPPAHLSVASGLEDDGVLADALAANLSGVFDVLTRDLGIAPSGGARASAPQAPASDRASEPRAAAASGERAVGRAPGAPAGTRSFAKGRSDPAAENVPRSAAHGRSKEGPAGGLPASKGGAGTEPVCEAREPARPTVPTPAAAVPLGPLDEATTEGRSPDDESRSDFAWAASFSEGFYEEATTRGRLPSPPDPASPVSPGADPRAGAIAPPEAATGGAGGASGSEAAGVALAAKAGVGPESTGTSGSAVPGADAGAAETRDAGRSNAPRGTAGAAGAFAPDSAVAVAAPERTQSLDLADIVSAVPEVHAPSQRERAPLEASRSAPGFTEAEIRALGLADGPDRIEIRPSDSARSSRPLPAPHKPNPAPGARTVERGRPALAASASTRFLMTAAGLKKGGGGRAAAVAAGAAAALVAALMGAGWAGGIFDSGVAEISPAALERVVAIGSGGEGVEADVAVGGDDATAARLREQLNGTLKQGAGWHRRSVAGQGIGAAAGASAEHGRLDGPRGDAVGSLAIDPIGARAARGEPAPVALPEMSPNDVPAASGDLSPAAVESMVRARQPSIRACYDQALRTNSHLRGKLEIELAVTPNGAVSKVRVHGSSAQAQGIGDCVAQKIRDWRFPSFAGSAAQEFRIPILLSGISR